ncbi:MAG TPA: tetratricopeptide repeat protein [Pseudogracilibacillus sp.]|nr:tetratricopeptide repeat protein [Pseudogracilibacillus sp.]
MDYAEQVARLVKENKVEEAVQLLLEAVEKEPENPLHYVNLGTLLFDHNQYEEAERFFLQALQLDEKMATAHYGLASLHYERGKYKEAATALRACIALEMEDPHVYYLTGMAYLNLKNPLLALPFLQRATELKEDTTYLFQYGLALAKLEHFTMAEEVFENVLSLDKNHADAMYNLAIVHIQTNRFEEGFSLLKKTLQLQPDHKLAEKALKQMTEKDE